MQIATSGAPTKIIGITQNQYHQTLPGGHSYGFWIDGPLVPWRGTDGEVYAIFPASENYLMKIGNFLNGHTWSLVGECFNSNRNTRQQDFDNRIWWFSAYMHSDGNLYLVGHHEWYNQTVSDGGHPGFNALNHRQWITTAIWGKSTDNGRSVSTKPYTSYIQTGVPNNHRVHLVPEPFGKQQRNTLYGFQHPSNTVEEDGYFYTFLDYNSLPGGTNLLDVGFILMRTANLNDPEATEVWTSSGWVASRGGAYWGNMGRQPHVFFPMSGLNPYQGGPRSDRMAQSVRYHPESGQWMLFGWRVVPGQLGTPCVTTSPTLSNPQFSEATYQPITLGTGDDRTWYNNEGYISVFDEDSTDPNFREIGNNPALWVADQYTSYRRTELIIQP